MKSKPVFPGPTLTHRLAWIWKAPCLLSLLFLLTVSSISLEGSPSPGPSPTADAPALQGDVQAAFRVARVQPDAAQVQCRVQQLDAHISPEGLTLQSTREADAKAELRLASDYLGRDSGALIALPQRGIVGVDDAALVRFVRPNCIEEFRVGLDGIRQDFVISRPPPGRGLLRLELRVHGAEVKQTGGRLELHFSGVNRVLSYGRLQVEDATGKTLKADMVRTGSDRIALLVDDSSAAYPVRIDPTFSDANWTGLGGISGTDAAVRAIVVDDTGNVYIGGAISVVGNVPVQQIAMWNGTRWSDLGEGLPITVDRLLIFEDSLYACGRRTGLQGFQVVKRDGSAWVQIGGVFNNQIEALKPHLGSIHAAGAFDKVDETTVNRVARWNGTSWQSLGTGLGGWVKDILSFNGELIAGGLFQTISSGVPANRVARWNGTSWSDMGSGLSGDVNTLVSYSGFVVAGGSFNMAGGSPALRVAGWNGSSWSGLGGMSENFVSVISLAVSGNTLYAAGNFTRVSGQPAHGLAQFNQTWSAVGTGFVGLANVVATFGSNVYVGTGRVDDAGFHSSGFSWWNGARWGSLGDTPAGIGGSVSAMVWHDDALHVGGFFRTAGGKVVNHIARWDGSEWHALGGGVSNPGSASVTSLAVFDGDLYVAGEFNRAGDIDVRNLARWDGESWSPLRGGTSGTVYSMATFDNKLVIGGQLILVDGIFVQNLIQWDGTNWVQMAGFGTGGSVKALTVHDGELYVGGSFFTPPNNVAKWNGSSFSGLGAGMNGEVSSLLSTPGKLYAGGRFTFAGGKPAEHIAGWNGSGWNALGTGVNLNVSSIAGFGGEIFVSGERASSPALPSGHLLSWNGTEWLEPGSGVNRQVNALLPVGDILYVGGQFSKAGGRAAAALARLDLQVAIPSRALEIGVTNDRVQLRFSGTPGASYHIIRSPRIGLTEDWSIISPAPLMADESGEFGYEDAEPLPGAAYYRAQEVD